MSRYYWDWKLLISNLMAYSLPILTLDLVDTRKATQILGIWYKWLPLIIIILFPFGDEPHFYGRLMMPYSFLLLFYPLLDRRTKIYSLIAFLVVITIATTDRSDTLRFIITLLLGLCARTKTFKLIKSYIKPTVITLVLSPFIFFTLAATGVFNILNIGEEMGWEYEITLDEGERTKQLFGDDRTFLYEEELISSIRNNYWIQGRSIARGYDSVFFGKEIAKDLGWKRMERQDCETAILNIFNYLGLIGVISFSIVIFTAIYKSVWKTRNQYTQILGLYLAFRFLYCWIEEFQKFDTNYIVFWIIIAFCYSPQIRSLSNKEFKHLIRTIINYKRIDSVARIRHTRT